MRKKPAGPEGLAGFFFGHDFWARTVGRQPIEFIVTDQEILGGTLVFQRTRVPFQALTDHLERGQTLGEAEVAALVRDPDFQCLSNLWASSYPYLTIAPARFGILPPEYCHRNAQHSSVCYSYLRQTVFGYKSSRRVHPVEH